MIRIPVWAAVVLVAAVPSVMWAADSVVPHVFAPGTTIRASEVNANFEAVQSARFTFVGGGDTRNGIPATELSHPLLDGNPDAILHVNATDLGLMISCINENGTSLVELVTDYAGGRWAVVGTCPGAKYSVVAFRSAR